MARLHLKVLQIDIFVEFERNVVVVALFTDCRLINFGRLWQLSVGFQLSGLIGVVFQYHIGFIVLEIAQTDENYVALKKQETSQQTKREKHAHNNKNNNKDCYYGWFQLVLSPLSVFSPLSSAFSPLSSPL